MKKYNLLALAACLWMTTACSDFLELNESGYNSVEYQFSTFDRTKAVATNVYGYLKDGYSEVFDHDRCGDGRRGECLEYKRNQRIL